MHFFHYYYMKKVCRLQLELAQVPSPPQASKNCIGPVALIDFLLELFLKFAIF